LVFLNFISKRYCCLFLNNATTQRSSNHDQRPNKRTDKNIESDADAELYDSEDYFQSIFKAKGYDVIDKR
jgi:hypothetical protein